MATVLAILSSLCFGLALITGRVGLRSLDARAGAAISIPCAAVLFLIASPFAFDVDGLAVEAVAVFAAVGLFFPAVVTLLTFRSNAVLGPTVTSAVSGTAPLFALLAASQLLGEQIPARATLSAAAVVVGVALLSWKKGAARSVFLGWSLLWPLSGAVVRGLAQVLAKAGLLIWASPFAASLIGYAVSSVAVVGVDRARHAVRQAPTRAAAAWFAATGVLNGCAVLLMYAALSLAPVWTVAPIVASYPLVTAMLGAALLHDEEFSWRAACGALIVVVAIAYLVSAHAGA
ncbi:MAG: DMT family transporter [Burkholderiaceae bacterium]